jgi:hypothetical protein
MRKTVFRKRMVGDCSGRASPVRCSKSKARTFQRRSMRLVCETTTGPGRQGAPFHRCGPRSGVVALLLATRSFSLGDNGCIWPYISAKRFFTNANPVNDLRLSPQGSTGRPDLKAIDPLDFGGSSAFVLQRSCRSLALVRM